MAASWASRVVALNPVEVNDEDEDEEGSDEDDGGGLVVEGVGGNRDAGGMPCAVQSTMTGLMRLMSASLLTLSVRVAESRTLWRTTPDRARVALSAFKMAVTSRSNP